MWQRLSVALAQWALDEVDVLLTKDAHANKENVWNMFEEPILTHRGVKINFVYTKKAADRRPPPRRVRYREGGGNRRVIGQRPQDGRPTKRGQDRRRRRTKRDLNEMAAMMEELGRWV